MSVKEAATAARHPGRGRWLGLAMLSLGVAMIIVDATIVNVAIPTIIRDLHIRLTTAEWVNSIYALVFAALLISVGRAGDLWGRRRLFLIGIVVFVGASVLAGRSSSGSELLLARFAQGVGGAIILPSTLSTVNATFRGRERAIAFGVWGSVIGGMAALGPLLGGWLTTTYSWRWAFYINVPFGILALVGALRFVPETRDEHAVRGFDPEGILAVTVGLAALVFGLIEGQSYGWWRPQRAFTVGGWTWPSAVSPIPVAFAVAAILLPSFLIIERRRGRAGRPALVDMTLFRIRSFSFGNVAALVVSLGEFGLLFAFPLFLQNVLGYSAFRTGVVLVALATGAFFAGPMAGPLAQRIGSRRVVSTGMALEAVGIGAVGLALSPTTSGWRLAPYLFVYGVGVGFASAQLTNVVLADVPPGRSGQASGLQSTARQVGSALGIAIIGTVFAVSLSHGTSSRLAEIPGLSAAAREGIAHAVSSTGGTVGAALCSPGTQVAGTGTCTTALASSLGGIVRDSIVTAAKHVSLVATIFVLLGLAASLLLPRNLEATSDELPGQRPPPPDART